MANTENNDKDLNIGDKKHEDFIGSGISERQYKRMSKSQRSEFFNEFAVTETAGNDSKDDQRGVFRFFKSFGKINTIAAVSLIFLLFMGVMGSGLGSKVINTFTSNKEEQNDLSNNSTATNQESLFSSINPFAEPMPSNTPQLSKEYIYAGSQLLNITDAGAVEIPPADLAVWRPSSGVWWVLGGTGSQQTTQQWGLNGDIPVPGDYDGDGKTDFTVFRPSNNQWYIVQSSTGATVGAQFGTAGDKPAAADFDGDGKTDVAVFRPSSGTWYILRSSDGGVTTQQFGLSGDLPNPADFDGDGKADIAVWRNSDTNFYELHSSDNSIITTDFSNTTTEPISADYTGDGLADHAIRNANNWIILNSTTDQFEATVAWQLSTDIAVPNDYDGDGKVDIAVWRGQDSAPKANDVGKWFIRKSSDLSTRIENWGIAGDIPVPAFYRR